MTYHIVIRGHPTTAIEKHGQRHFRLVASYDGVSDMYLVHVYVSEQAATPYIRSAMSEPCPKHVELLRNFSTIDAAFEAGEAAAISHFEGN